MIVHLYGQVSKIKDENSALKELIGKLAKTEEVAKMIRQETGEIKQDTKALAAAVNNAVREFDRKVYDVMIEIANKSKASDK